MRDLTQSLRTRRWLRRPMATPTYSFDPDVRLIRLLMILAAVLLLAVVV